MMNYFILILMKKLNKRKRKGKITNYKLKNYIKISRAFHLYNIVFHSINLVLLQ